MKLMLRKIPSLYAWLVIRIAMGGFSPAASDSLLYSKPEFGNLMLQHHFDIAGSDSGSNSLHLISLKPCSIVAKILGNGRSANPSFKMDLVYSASMIMPAINKLSI